MRTVAIVGNIPWIPGTRTNAVGRGLHTSVLDADLLVVNPAKISELWSEGTRSHSGVWRLNRAQGAHSVRRYLSWLEGEVYQLLEAGRIILFPLVAVSRCELEGEGVAHNYSWLPAKGDRLADLLVTGRGAEIQVPSQRSALTPFLRAARGSLEHSCYIEPHNPGFEPLATTRTGAVVAFTLGLHKGHLIGIPLPNGKEAAERCGPALVNGVISYYHEPQPTTSPGWLGRYCLPDEPAFEQEVRFAQSRLDAEKRKLIQAEAALSAYIAPKAILFEQGRALEQAVSQVIAAFGFQTTTYASGTREHDVIGRCEEGVIVVEVEGRDTASIELDKARQLGANVDQHFEDHKERARGVLVGNPHRLQDPADRGTPFTAHVRDFAAMRRFMVCPTPQLYEAYRRYLSRTDKTSYARKVRHMLLDPEALEFVAPEDGG